MKMDYNQFSYYRANPYAAEGYIPPIAHTNRHKPDFRTQIPMGESNFEKIGKRFYPTSHHRSNIKEDHIFEALQLTDHQNKPKLNKNYERNLTTLDIEGASSGTVMSQGMRNKLKARKQLERKKLQHLDNSNHDLNRQGINNPEKYIQYRSAHKQYQQQDSQRKPNFYEPKYKLENDVELNRIKHSQEKDRYYSIRTPEKPLYQSKNINTIKMPRYQSLQTSAMFPESLGSSRYTPQKKLDPNHETSMHRAGRNVINT